MSLRMRPTIIIALQIYAELGVSMLLVRISENSNNSFGEIGGITCDIVQEWE
jgi:hypothetical protein